MIIFLVLLKHILWVLVRIPRQGGTNVYPQSMFLAKIRKISYFFSTETFHFFFQRKNLCTLHCQVFVNVAECNHINIAVKLENT